MRKSEEYYIKESQPQNHFIFSWLVERNSFYMVQVEPLNLTFLYNKCFYIIFMLLNAYLMELLLVQGCIIFPQ